MKNNLDFFTHYTDAYQNGKFLLLRASYPDIEKALAMEARFWILNSLIGRAVDAKLDLSQAKNRAEVVDALKLNLADFKAFVDLLATPEIDLIHKDGDVIWTEQTQEDLARAMKSREEGRDRYNAKKTTSGEKGESSGENPQTSGAGGYRAEQSRLDESIKEQLAARGIKMTEEEAETSLAAFALARAKSTRGVKNAGAYAKKLATQDDVIAAWIEELGAAQPKAPKLDDIAPVCPECKKAASLLPRAPGTAREAICHHDKLAWTFDDDFESWGEPEVLTPVSAGAG
jgi:hypothetical protein